MMGSTGSAETRLERLLKLMKADRVAEFVKEVTDSGFELESIEGGSLLSWAIILECDDAVTWLLNAGVNPNTRLVDGSTALSCTVNSRQIATLIEAGASILAEAPVDGETALHLACSRGDSDSVKLLVSIAMEVCPDYLERKNAAGMTPLICAVESGNCDTVKLLLELGVDASIEDPAFESVVDRAEVLKFDSIAEVLRAAGRNLRHI